LTPSAIAALNAAFVAEYRSTYQYASDGELEAVALRVVGRGVRKAKVDFRSIRIVGDVSPETAVGSRRVFFDRTTGWRDTPVVTRAEIAGSMAGPLIIESSDTTIVIPPNASIARDAAGNIVASLDRG
jgi:N-methylhydantoinase A